MTAFPPPPGFGGQRPPPPPSPHAPPPPAGPSQEPARPLLPAAGTTSPASAIPLPSIDYSLHPAVQWYWRLPVLVFGLLSMLVLSIIAVASDTTQVWFLVVLAVVATIVGAWLLPSMRYDRWTWRLSTRALEAEHGLFVHQTRMIPFFRIQHIDVQHGPIDRHLGLAQLRIHTASVTATLPGLSDAIATQLRVQLLELAATETALAEADARDAV